MARKPLGFMQLNIMVGFSLYYGWYLVAFFGLFVQPGEMDFIDAHAGQVAFFAGNIAATIGVLALFRNEGSVRVGHGRFVYLASLLPGLAMPGCFIALGLGASVSPMVFYACCLLSGLSVAVGFMQWEDLSTHGYLNRGVLSHGAVFCAGGVLFLTSTLFFPTLGLSVCAVILLACSTALLAFIVPRCDFIEDKPVEPVRAYFRSVWHIDAVVIVISIAFGFAFILLYWKDHMIMLAAMGVSIAADLALSIILDRGKWVQFTGAVRICAAIVSCALILFICPVQPTRDIALCAIIVSWFMFRTVNGGSLASLARERGFSVLYSALRGKLPANLGFMLGLVLGIAVIRTGLPDIATMYAPLALVAAFILSALFLLPFDGESSTAGYKTLTLVDLYESPDQSMEELCEQVSKRFKLSPRESEVLMYLMRGRNAKHASEKLFISESTVKTHISNIYRKIGVHSQQELLDALEELS